jgi:hypothetical protein
VYSNSVEELSQGKASQEDNRNYVTKDDVALSMKTIIETPDVSRRDVGSTGNVDNHNRHLDMDMVKKDLVIIEETTPMPYSPISKDVMEQSFDDSKIVIEGSDAISKEKVIPAVTVPPPVKPDDDDDIFEEVEEEEVSTSVINTVKGGVSEGGVQNKVTSGVDDSDSDDEDLDSGGGKDDSEEEQVGG